MGSEEVSVPVSVAWGQAKACAKVAFATTRDGLDEIVLMSPAGGSVTRIGTGLPGFAPTWSPDGAQLALVQVYDAYEGTYDIVVLARADGSSVRYLTGGDQPAWKPHS